MIPGKIVPGTVIEPISPNRGMAIFKSGSGGRFIRVKEEDGVWKAITLLEYKGPGLVVFLADINEENDLQQIGPGEVLKSDLKVRVTNVYDRHAVGEILGANRVAIASSNTDTNVEDDFEDLFNDLIDEIDTDNPKEQVKFGGELFTRDEFPTLLKLCDALYNQRDSEEGQEGTDEDGNRPTSDRDNETSNSE